MALPPDVDDVARAIDGYDDLAEGLVALLHTQVPSVFDADIFFKGDAEPCFRRPRLDWLIPSVRAVLGSGYCKESASPTKFLTTTYSSQARKVWAALSCNALDESQGLRRAAGKTVGGVETLLCLGRASRNWMTAWLVRRAAS